MESALIIPILFLSFVLLLSAVAAMVFALHKMYSTKKEFAVSVEALINSYK